MMEMFAYGKLVDKKAAQIMSIINITPDSFSDGGLFLEKDKALAHIKKSIANGANIIDIGAESTAPHNSAISEHTEWERLENVLPHVFTYITILNNTQYLQKNIKISLDSYKLETWKKFINLAEKCNFDINTLIINDVSGLNFLDKNIYTNKILFIKKYSDKFPKFQICIMFSKHNVPQNTVLTCKNIFSEIILYFTHIIKHLQKHSIDTSHIIIDTGMGGFLSKDPEISIHLLQNLQILKTFADTHNISNLLIGTSRKKFLSVFHSTLHENPSIASSLLAIENGANIIRIHDTLLLKKALKVKYS